QKTIDAVRCRTRFSYHAAGARRARAHFVARPRVDMSSLDHVLIDATTGSLEPPRLVLCGSDGEHTVRLTGKLDCAQTEQDRGDVHRLGAIPADGAQVETIVDDVRAERRHQSGDDRAGRPANTPQHDGS